MKIEIDTNQKILKISECTMTELVNFCKLNSYTQYTIKSTNEPETLTIKTPDDASSVTTLP